MSSLFSALSTAVAGLTAQSSAIGNISDNLANAQTTGYKSVGTDFQELVSASNATVNNPGGVRATPQYQNDVQGSISSSNTATSLAISGEGYFAVQTATTNAAGVTNFNGEGYYTRQGDFTLDKDGYLVKQLGFLPGWFIRSMLMATVIRLRPALFRFQHYLIIRWQPRLSITSPICHRMSHRQIAAPYSASTSTVQVYDALGNTYDLNYTWVKNPDTANTWDLHVDAAKRRDFGQYRCRL